MSKALITSASMVAGGAVAIGIWAVLATGGRGEPGPSEKLSVTTSLAAAPVRPVHNPASGSAAPSRAAPVATGMSYTDLATEKSLAKAEEDKQKYEELVLKHDLDGDGELNDEEKAAMWEEIKQLYMADRIARFDKDGDGELNEQEERSARLSDLLRSDYGQGLAQRYDIDRDGVLNDAEIASLEAGLAQLKRQVVDKNDLDGDGGLDDLEQEIAKESYEDRMARLKGGYEARHDTDGDGALSEAEQAAAWAAFGAVYQQQRYVMGNDSNADGVVDNADLGDYMDRFNDSDPTADLNGDGLFDSADLDEFNRRIDEGENTMPEGDDRLPDEWFVEGIDDKPEDG
ncbi:MAG: hypothetical protein ACI89L_000073 [Phycisphaerales bacterium]|jgi:hypothetical protein